MSIVIRPGIAADAAACGTICYEAFKAIGEAHNFPPDFPSPEVATGLLSMLLTHPRFYSVVAESDGRIVGSNFLDERSCIAGVGRRSDKTERRRRRATDAGRSGSRGPAAGSGGAAVAGGLPQPFALSLYQARFSYPRANVDPPGQAARTTLSG